MSQASEKLAVNRMLAQNGFGQLSDPGLIPQLGFVFGKVIRTHEQLKQLINKCHPRERSNMLNALRPYLCFTPKPLDIYVSELGAEAAARRLPTVDEHGVFHEYKVPEIRNVQEIEDVFPLVDPADVSFRALQLLARVPEGAILHKLPYPAALDQEQPRYVLDKVRAIVQFDPVHDLQTCRLTVGYELPAAPKLKTDLAIANAAIREEMAEKHLHVVCGACTREEQYHGWDKTAALTAARADGWQYDEDHERELCPSCAKK